MGGELIAEHVNTGTESNNMFALPGRPHLLCLELLDKCTRVVDASGVLVSLVAAAGVRADLGGFCFASCDSFLFCMS